jgi:hypothetical protein
MVLSITLIWPTNIHLDTDGRESAGKIELPVAQGISDLKKIGAPHAASKAGVGKQNTL